MISCQKRKCVAALPSLALAAFIFGGLAVPAVAEDVGDLVAQGSNLTELDEGELQLLLEQTGSALDGTADANQQAQLENLEAAITDSLEAQAAAEAGTLDELPQSGAENSWRYQNGTLVLEDTANDADIALATYSADGDTHFGIDVSDHNGIIDWDTVKSSGVEFVIIRCGYGGEWDGEGEYKQDDDRWERNASECERLGIPYGVYMYSYATSTSDAKSEAEHTLRLLRGHSPQLPIFYDLEENKQALLGTDVLGDIAQTWCDIVQKEGFRVGIYANQNWWYHYLTADNFNNKDWYRWVACYGTLTYTGRRDAWQYSSRGTIGGISGRVDVNYWYGNYPTGKVPVATPTPTPSPTPRPTASPEAANAFTTRLYRYCLGRDPDEAGLKNWSADLQTGAVSGSEASYGFVFSSEFKAKNLCNTDYVKQLYLVFFDRMADDAGLDTWLKLLTGGATREEVFNGFVGSTEFKALCAANGIYAGEAVPLPAHGTVPTGPCSICNETDGVTAFVTRLYKVFLNRAPDSAGLADWCGKLWDYTANGRGVANGFVFSKEFTDKKYSNAQFVEYLYKGLMGRDSDASGKKDWVAKLDAGATRESVFTGFIGSAEFTNLCNSYGIERG